MAPGNALTNGSLRSAPKSKQPHGPLPVPGEPDQPRVPFTNTSSTRRKPVPSPATDKFPAQAPKTVMLPRPATPPNYPKPAEPVFPKWDEKPHRIPDLEPLPKPAIPVSYAAFCYPKPGYGTAQSINYVRDGPLRHVDHKPEFHPGTLRASEMTGVAHGYPREESAQPSNGPVYEHKNQHTTGATPGLQRRNDILPQHVSRAPAPAPVGKKPEWQPPVPCTPDNPQGVRSIRSPGQIAALRAFEKPHFTESFEEFHTRPRPMPAKPVQQQQTQQQPQGGRGRGAVEPTRGRATHRQPSAEQQAPVGRKPFLHEPLPGIVAASDYNGADVFYKAWRGKVAERQAARREEKQKAKADAAQLADSGASGHGDRGRPSRPSSQSSNASGSWARIASPFVSAVRSVARSLSRDRSVGSRGGSARPSVDAEREKNEFLKDNVPAKSSDNAPRRRPEESRKPVGHGGFAAAKNAESKPAGLDQEKSKRRLSGLFSSGHHDDSKRETTFDWVIDAAEGRIPAKPKEVAPPLPTSNKSKDHSRNHSNDSQRAKDSKSSNATSLFNKILHKKSNSNDTDSILSFQCIGDETGTSDLLRPTAGNVILPTQTTSLTFEQYEKEKAEGRRKEREAAEASMRERDRAEKKAQAEMAKLAAAPVQRKPVVKEDKVPAELHHLAYPEEAPKGYVPPKCDDCGRMIVREDKTCSVCAVSTFQFPKPSRPASSIYTVQRSNSVQHRPTSLYTLPGNPFVSEASAPAVPEIPADYRQGPAVPPKLPLSPARTQSRAVPRNTRRKTFRADDGEKRDTSFYQHWDEILTSPKPEKYRLSTSRYTRYLD